MADKKRDDDERDEREYEEAQAASKARTKVAPVAGRKPSEHSFEEMERMRREDPMFIEKTKPEDPSGRPGQLTRDNVNPNIPSGERGAPTNAGGIVDPNSLGMEQGGIPPTSPMQPETPTAPPAPPKIAAPHEDDEKKKDRK